MPYDSTSKLKMPNIKALMDEGATFTRAITPSPLCVPARACLASCMNYDDCGAFNNTYCYPPDKPTFYSALSDNGYRVATVGKSDLHKPVFYWGRDGWIDELRNLGITDAVDSEGKYDLLWSSFYQPKGPYSDFLHKNGLMKTHAIDYIKRYYDVEYTEPTPLPDFAYCDNWVADNSLMMLDRLTADTKSWCLSVNFSGPHNPWDVTRSMLNDLGDSFDNEVQRNYAAMLENIDRNVGRIIDKLKESGEYSQTLIIYTSDHGEMLGDHDRYFKCVPFNASLSIPLIVAGAGKIQTDALVQLNDVGATILDYAGCCMPNKTDGKSVLPLIRGSVNRIRDYQYSALDTVHKYEGEYLGYERYKREVKQKSDREYIEEYATVCGVNCEGAGVNKYDYKKVWRCVISNEYKYVNFGDGYELLYKNDDTNETQNLASNSSEIIEQFRQCLKELEAHKQ